MILEKETALFNDGAIAALEELATGKSTVFYQASAPAVAGRKVNDIWFDTDDGNTMYRFNGTTWAKQQFGDAAIVAGSITAAKINTQDLYTNFLVTNILNAAQASISSLSAITADIGEVTAGVLKSSNYSAPTSATGDYSAAGMLIDLTNGVIRTKNFAVLADGSAHINTSLTLGGANNASGVITVKDATGATIGTWNKDGINATNANISGSVTTVSGNNKFILNTGTLNGYYANNLVGALSIARSTYDLTSVIRQLDPVIQQQIPYTSVTASVLKLTSSNSVGFITGNVGEIDLTTNNGNCGIIIKDVREYFHLTTGVDVDVARWASPSLTFKGNSMFTDSIRIQRSTSNGVSFDTANPQIQFCNSNASQNVALVFTDQDSVQAPATLILAGNQGGEYFIAPNIKVTDGLEVGTAKFYLPSEVTATKSGSYITSGTITVRRRGNVAHIYGNITIGSAVASQTTIATIPDGYRPITTDFFSATNGSFFRVNSNGTIQAQNALTAGNYYFSTTYPLS